MLKLKLVKLIRTYDYCLLRQFSDPRTWPIIEYCLHIIKFGKSIGMSVFNFIEDHNIIVPLAIV